MKFMKWIVSFSISLMVSCGESDLPVNPDNGTSNPAYGTVIFNFPLPDADVPERGLHRVDLSLARTLDSLERQEFCHAANVSDYKQNYTFSLVPGRYFFRAGVTCTCGGDTCLYGGFHGGPYSIWWTSGWVDVEKGKTFSKPLVFK
jgi:hypothetical protein